MDTLTNSSSSDDESIRDKTTREKKCSNLSRNHAGKKKSASESLRSRSNSGSKKTKNIKNRSDLDDSDDDDENMSISSASSSNNTSEANSSDSDFERKTSKPTTKPNKTTTASSSKTKHAKSNSTSNNNNNNNNNRRRVTVKSSSDDESGESEDSDTDKSSNDDYEESDDSDEDDDEDDEEESEEDNDDEDDEDYFEYRRSKRTSSKKLSKAKSSVNKKVTNKSSKVTSSTRSLSNKSNKKSGKKSSQEKRATTSKTINYCEETDEDEEDDYDEDDDFDESTFSSKNVNTSAGAKQESVDEANVETIEKVLKHRLGREGATGSKTAIYNVEENGDPNANFDVNKETSSENQYLIKWQNWSHLHNTWETKESLLLQKVKGMKKLENFLKKDEEIRRLKMEASCPEDVEYIECQAEMLESLWEAHQSVERIIASNVLNDGINETTDFLCKWQGLPYSECTWEDGELIKKRFSKLIDEYYVRESSQTLPPIAVKTQKYMKVRPRFVPLKEMPDYFGKLARQNDPDLKLRDYQLDGLNWLANSWCKQNSIILADEMGLGKTIQAISFLSYVFNHHMLYGPFLIVIPLSTIQGWQREFQKWSPEINVVIYLGDGNSRSMIQKHEWAPQNKKIKCNVIITTYEILLKDKSFFNSVSWAALVVDEAHRLKNEDSLLYRTLITFCTNHRILITGTPLQNSLKELWALLHFIMPEKFQDWEEFDSKYSSVLSDGAGFQDLHKELQPYLLRRVKKDVEKSLPAKVEQILRVEMTKIQKQYYKLILTKNFKELNKGAKGNISSFLNIMMELKKCSNHIYLTRRDDSNSGNIEKLIKGSGKLLLLDKLLIRLKETGHRVLIFSQMVRMLDILAEYLQYRRFPFQRLDGSIKGEIRRQALDHFNKEDSEDFCFLLSTRAGGLGINLATADTVIIYDSDWNPQNDLQAQARAHRIGQKNQVNIYRLVSKNSIEEDIVERTKQKLVLDHLVIQRMDTTGRTVLNKSNIPGNSSIPYTKDEINSILKFGAEELFKEKDSNNLTTASTSGDQIQDEREELQLYDIDEILKRAETREDNNHTSASEELLSQFKIANFSTLEEDPIITDSNKMANAANNKVKEGDNSGRDWKDIIPESERIKVEIEEESERLKQLNMPLGIRRNRALEATKKEQEEKQRKKHSSKSKKAANNQSSADNTDESYDENNNDEDDDDDDSDSGKKKRSKKSSNNAREHVIKGLNAQEVRRFVRSYRKFPCPLERIDIIAQDAQLEEKSQAFLVDFANKMESLSKTCLQEFETNNQTKTNEDSNENDQNEKKAREKEKGPSFFLNGVKLYAKQLLESEKYFEPFVYYQTSLNEPNKKSFEFKSKLKHAYWDCEWTEEDDKSLLRGIYEYGYGNWEWIKADPQLNLGEKILPNKPVSSSKSLKPGETKNSDSKSAKLKPQPKHLRTRVDYLIKILQNQINIEKFGPEWKEKLTSKSSRSRKKQVNDITIDGDSNSMGKNSLDLNSTVNMSSSRSTKKKNVLKDVDNKASVSQRSSKKSKRKLEHDHVRDSNESDNSDSNSDTKKKRNNHDINLSSANNHSNLDADDLHSDNEHSNKKAHTSHKKDSHLHHNHHQTPQNQAQQPKEKKIILNEKTFNECKNILKPVKKALKNIDKIKEMGVSEKDNTEKVKSLLEIGDLINDHLGAFNDPKKINEWRNFLWIFVAKFTTWDFERLKNLYKRFASNRDEEAEEQQQRSSVNINRSLNSNSSMLNSRSSSNNSSDKKKSSNSEYWRGDNRDSSNYKNSNRPPSLLSTSFHNTNHYHRGSADHDSHNQHYNNARFGFRDNNNTYSPNTSFSNNHRQSDHNTSNMNHSYSEHTDIGGGTHHQNYYGSNDFSSRPKGSLNEHYKSPYSSNNLKKHTSSSATSFNDIEYKKLKIESKTSTEDDDYSLGVLGVAHHKKEFANEQLHSPRNQYRSHLSSSTSSRHHH